MAGKIIGANGRRLAAENHAEALARAGELFPIVVEFRGSGLSYRRMVQRLNERCEPTPGQEGRWHVRTLQRLVARAPEVEALLARQIIARADAAAWGEAALTAHQAPRAVSAERVEAALARSYALRTAHQAVMQRAAELMAHARTLRLEMMALRDMGLRATRLTARAVEPAVNLSLGAGTR